MANRIDLSFRPDTYWPESRTPEQLLARIKGTVRRNAARRIFAERGFAGLSAFLVRDELPADDLTRWGAFIRRAWAASTCRPRGPGRWRSRG